MDFPWSPGSATGIGSLPLTDVTEAVKVVFGELPDLPYLPELPGRGPGADLIGRTAGLLVAMPVELYAAQWRIASHRGRDAGRTADMWHRDLDALTDQGADFTGPVKVQVAGPWTLAASIDLPIGGRLLRDPGAVRDLVGSLAEGIAAHVRDVGARLPHARVLLQLDEPSLPAVLAGHVATESGFSVLRAVEDTAVRDALRSIVAAAGVPVVMHCCAPDAPIGLFREAGAIAIAIDLDLVTDLDPLGEVLEAGLGLFAGAVPTGGGARSVAAGQAAPRWSSWSSSPSDEPDPSRSRNGGGPSASPSQVGPGSTGGGRPDTARGPAGSESAAAANRVRELWRTIGFSINELPAQVVVTPACGLAGVRESRAREIMAICREAGRRLADD